MALDDARRDLSLRPLAETLRGCHPPPLRICPKKAVDPAPSGATFGSTLVDPAAHRRSRVVTDALA
jgi:hypothetical protein